MAQSYVGTEATQYIPGATASIKVENTVSGGATAGIVILVGEADAGPDFSLEADLNNNVFGPDQDGAVIAKYKSGPVVDAFKAAAQPLDDANIPGAPAGIIIVKTNPSTQASGSLKKADASTYATIRDVSYGKDGNLIFASVESAQAEVVPTIGTFAWTPPAGDIDIRVVINGVPSALIDIPATTTAAALATILTTAGLAVTVDGSNLTVSSPAGAVIAGVGKSLEIVELTSGTNLLSASVAPNTWVSKDGAAKVHVSAAEYKARLLLSRQKDNISEDHVAGGEIGLKISYKGTTATLTVNDTVLTTTVTGGTGANLSLSLKDFPTIADLAAYISAQTGYSASPGTAVIGNLPATALDDGTYGICTIHGALTGRIKVDAYRFYNTIQSDAILAKLTEQPAAGLPAVQAAFTLAGGAKGGTTASAFASALSAVEKVRGNFVVPCFSRDATADITDGKTESTSTYEISAIHALVKTHQLAMSKVKRRKNRQGFLSIRDTFENCKEAAANIGTWRCSMSFLDQKVVASDDTVQQLPPYIDAAIAAGAQAAGFYKSFTKKVKNVSGSLQKAGDFDDSDETQVEEALKAGLLVTRRRPNGGYEFVSDQTTYSKNSNWLFNSIQAVYVSDYIALDAARQMEEAFAGQSQADVSATVALAFLESLFEEYKRQKLIASSDDAPAGFKNASIRINGPAMVVNAEIKVAGTIYFIPITFFVSQVQQSAGA